MASTRLIIALFAAFLGGCVPTQTYIAPPREDNSALKFSLTPMPELFYFFLNGENCTDSVRLTHEDNPYTNKSGSLIVPSNKLIALSLLWRERNMYCNVIVSFKLESNKDYELVGGLFGGLDSKLCHVAIVDSELSDDLSQTWINLKKMRSVVGLTANTCKPEPTHQALPEGSGGYKDYSKLNTYIAAITAKIRHNLSVPPGLSGNPIAMFEIEQIKTTRGGEIVSVKLKQSSGNRELDDAIERAIHKSDPLPISSHPDLFRQKLAITFRPLDKPGEKPTTSQPVTGADTSDAAAMALKLEDEIAESERPYNQHPHRKQIGSTTREYRFAKYIKDWRIKTERIAKLNYPREARGKMYDSLLMTVSIKKDGYIERVVINRPSKYPVLNEAAERIVRLGEPYAPFPPEIARDTDILDITRTWTFTNNLQGNQLVLE